MSLKPAIAYRPEYECILKDEGAVIAECVAILHTVMQDALERSGAPQRAVHTKGHAVLDGRLEVLDALPEELRQGLFAHPASYPVGARLSSALPEMGPDAISTARGFALKVLLGKSSATLGACQAQDFLLVNAPAFFVGDIRQLLRLMRLLPFVTDRFKETKRRISPLLQGLEQLAEHLGYRSTGLLAMAGQPPTHPLAETYYSQVPILFGRHMAKVALVPVSAGLLALQGQRLDLQADENRLRHAMVDFFLGHNASWELRVQLCRNLETMPIEDASVIWPEAESPYLPVARLEIPMQNSWEQGAALQENALSFSPWHCLEAHRPLGSIMRARQETYRFAAGFRRQAATCAFHA